MSERIATAPVCPLRIAVIGLGGIGSTLAFQLAHSGKYDVTAIARPGSLRFAQVRENQGIVNVAGECATMVVMDTLDVRIAYDVVIVTLKAHQLDSILPALKESAAKTLLFMFNIFDPERLQHALGGERCSFGMPFLQAVIDREGKLQATIGAAGQKSKLDNQRLVQVFNGSGIPAVFEPQMLLWLRCHVPLCIAFESVSVAAVRRGGGASWSKAMTIALGVKESFSLIRSLGGQIYPTGKQLLDRGPAWIVAMLLWSVSRIKSFRELLSTGAEECGALIDALVAASPKGASPDVVKRIEGMRPTHRNNERMRL